MPYQIKCWKIKNYLKNYHKYQIKIILKETTSHTISGHQTKLIILNVSYARNIKKDQQTKTIFLILIHKLINYWIERKRKTCNSQNKHAWFSNPNIRKTDGRKDRLHFTTVVYKIRIHLELHRICCEVYKIAIEHNLKTDTFNNNI